MTHSPTPQYTDFQSILARFGFTETPITEMGFDELIGVGFSLDDCYGIACDISAGFPPDESIAAAKEARNG